MPGLFIAVEGIDGSGTTTFINNLKKLIEEKGEKVHTTCEPSNHTVGKYIRTRLGEGKKDNTAYALLFAADRLIHYREEILPAIEDNYIVISDRYILSSLAYQSVNEDFEFVKIINSKVPQADLTIFVDVDVLEGDRRIDRRGNARDALENLSFQEKVYRNYHKLINENPSVKVLDGTLNPNDLAIEGFKLVSELI